MMMFVTKFGMQMIADQFVDEWHTSIMDSFVGQQITALFRDAVR